MLEMGTVQGFGAPPHDGFDVELLQPEVRELQPGILGLIQPADTDALDRYGALRVVERVERHCVEEEEEEGEEFDDEDDEDDFEDEEDEEFDDEDFDDEDDDLDDVDEDEEEDDEE